MLWIKALHIVFIASWFAGLFYLPRIFVNLAQESEVVARERLLGMGRRLYRFTGITALLALGSGAWLLALTWHLALLNQAPTSAYFAQTLQIWEQGRFIRFYGLGQWLGWLWPYVTLLYVVFRVSRRDAGA